MDQLPQQPTTPQSAPQQAAPVAPPKPKFKFPTEMVDLPSKLPFIKMDLNSMPKIPLRNPLPTIYSRKLNQQSQEYVYDTSHGEIRKKVGQEDATFYNILRSQMEQMRANR